jgi:DNA repair protein RAD50
MDECKERFNKANEKIARLGGRRGEIIEQIRSLNRKLQSEEYKNVDERHRKEKVKYDTTQMAIHDLDSYSSALDKALLRFHSIKIAEINKIIKELWTLTYKGEDISSIELESGQENRAAKSYNYRVVSVFCDLCFSTLTSQS